MSDTPQTPREIAVYVAALSGDLAGICRRARLDHIAYILELAMMEAQLEASKRVDPSQ
jgi:hypothetical protein